MNFRQSRLIGLARLCNLNDTNKCSQVNEYLPILGTFRVSLEFYLDVLSLSTHLSANSSAECMTTSHFGKQCGRPFWHSLPSRAVSSTDVVLCRIQHPSPESRAYLGSLHNGNCPSLNDDDRSNNITRCCKVEPKWKA